MFKWDHRRIQVCCVVVFLLFLLLVAARPQFGAPQGYTGMAIRGYRVSLLAGYLACTVFLCSMVLWKGNIKNRLLYGSSAAISFILLPAASFIIFETIAGNIGSIIQNGQVWMFLNLCIWYLLYGAVFAVTNSTRGTAFLMLAFTYVLAGAANYGNGYPLYPYGGICGRRIPIYAYGRNDNYGPFYGFMLSLGGKIQF